VSVLKFETPRPAAIQVDNVTKVYRVGDQEIHALHGVSLRIERGEFVAIMGASGSGKSTLMNVIGCLDQPTTGQYLLEGTDVARLAEPELARIRSLRIGFVFQSFNLLARTTAAENVALPLFYSGQLNDNARRVHEALELLGLAEREKNHPSQLSGGQQQRVAIARALINNPTILLADEPTGNLDSKTAKEILETIHRLNRERGLTVVLVTHEASLGATADRTITMSDGVVVSDERRAPVQRIDSPLPPGEGVGVRGELSPEQIPELAPPLAEAWSFVRMALSAAGRGVGRNKLRSALTMLGIFIGVAALIAMLAVGEGASAALKKQLESLGTNLLVVLPGTTRVNGVRAGIGSASTLRVTDGAAILEEDPAVADISYVNRQGGTIVNGSQNWSTTIQGVTPSYLAIRDWPVVLGRRLDDRDEDQSHTVCLLGQTVLANLFGEYQNPIGSIVRVRNVDMEVVGVLAVKGHSASGQDQDDTVLIPFRTSQERVLGVAAPSSTQAQSTVFIPPPNPFGIQSKLTGFVHTMYVQARSEQLVKTALQQVTATLERRHRIRPGQPDDFTVRDLTEIAEVAEQSSRVMELLLAAIASISLLVGGIGIMNILLVSVTERTREIGVRMAIGARRVHVLLQFLVEASLLSLMGGGAGVLMGVACSKLISALAGWPTLLHGVVVAAAFLFSAAIGVFFGYYPARQASRLNPIDALRYE
jgi:macrolide transport system ATP-binding/permease protein